MENICNKNSFILVFLNISFVLISISFAQQVSIGICPSPPTVRNLNLTRYSGLWYEAEKYWFIAEATTSCLSVRYFPNFGVEVKQTEDITRKKWINPGQTRYRSSDGSADLILDLVVTQSPLPFTFSFPYLILDTDYENYTIKYACLQLGPARTEFLWILSRTKYYPTEVKENVRRSLQYLGVDSTRLRPSRNRNCDY